MRFRKRLGELAEDAVQAAVEAAFSPDFVFRSPRHEGGNEVTDVLVLFGDVALVIQAKAKTSDTRDPTAWAAKNLKKAVRQLHGGIRALRTGRVRYVSNQRRTRVLFDATEHRFMYGLAVLHHDSPPYKAGDLVSSVTTAAFPIHVLSYSDFANLASFLDTPWDLIDYLEHRTDVLVPTLDPRVHEEEDVFEYYVDRFEEIHAVRARGRGDEFTVEDARPTAEFWRGVLAGAIDVLPGRIIDILIDRCHDIDPDLEPLEVGGERIESGGRSSHAIIASTLAAIPRARRVALGKRAVRLASGVAKAQCTDWFLTCSRRRDDCLLYVVSPLPKDRRTERRGELLRLTSLAKSYCRVSKAIGITTTAPGEGGGAEDYVFLERPEPEPRQEIVEAGRELFGELRKRLVDK
ncbi:MAG: hypothetical protein LAO51_01640 [Acidobacteriia bacterium]|nr:hypothetical protein [Terriglobia bacterium]